MDPGQTDLTGSGGRSKRILPEHLMMRWGSAENRDGPIFLQLAWFLTNLIIEGELDEGDLLPSETTLAEQFGMSRMTARRAVESLRDIGVVSRNRRGTRIDVSPDEAVLLSGQFRQLLYNHQLADAERFGDIVVGAQALADLKAVEARQHHVEDDELV